MKKVTAIQKSGDMDYRQQVEYTSSQIGVGTMPLQDNSMYCTIQKNGTWEVGVYGGRVVADGQLETIPTRSYLGHGFSAGQIIVEAKNRADAWEQIQQIEWNTACSCGNHPDPGKEEDVVEIPRFIDVYAFEIGVMSGVNLSYRRKNATGGWDYFTTPEKAYAAMFAEGYLFNSVLHRLTVRLEA